MMIQKKTIYFCMDLVKYISIFVAGLIIKDAKQAKIIF
jgi:hypothetical protein